jgi:hypothetical protein
MKGEKKMKSYKVVAKQFGKWEVTDIHLNKLAAECIRDYYLDRGIEACVEEEWGLDKHEHVVT